MQLKTSLSQSLKSVALPTYADANGNITEYVNSQGSTVAHYEYSPFGQITFQSGERAEEFAYRYSSKYYCPRLNMNDFGMRWYSPEVGRFINRDPIEERGGDLLYGFCRNDGVNGWDYLGMVWKVERKGEAYALAQTEDTNDTFNDLADKVALDITDYKEWAHTQDEKPEVCKDYKVPNKIYYHFGARKFIDRIFTNIISIWRRQNKRNSKVDEDKGFMVVWSDNVSDSDITTALADDYIYQYIFTGHGALNGVINVYESVGTIPDRYTKYGINLLRLNSCGSADKVNQFAIDKGYWKYNSWEWNVATKGVFIGYEGPVTAVDEMFRWRITHGKNRKDVP